MSGLEGISLLVLLLVECIGRRCIPELFHSTSSERSSRNLKSIIFPPARAMLVTLTAVGLLMPLMISSSVLNTCTITRWPC